VALADGDTVTVAIDGIGELSTSYAAAAAPGRAMPAPVGDVRD
jgi:hypothetical protein